MKRLLIALLVLPGLLVEGSPTASPKRILTLGIRHESNTFSTALTRLSDFTVKRGQEALNGNSWATYAGKQGIELIPTLHAYSWPGGVVEKEAFELFKGEILAGIRRAGKLDGIYMDMHGALHVQGYTDAQATLINEIRALVGKEILISASFDLHGNLSTEFVGGLNLVTAYRTAPHRDVEETRLRAMVMLIEALQRNKRPVIESITIPILVPGEKSITDQLPLRPIYEQIPAVAKQTGLLDASILAGYCWADLPRSAMRVFVLAEDSSHRLKARDAAVQLARQIWEKRADLQLSVPSGSFPEMFKKARQSKAKTVFISDSGDNTTAGAPGDNTLVLQHLIKEKAKQVLLAGIVDPAAFATLLEKQEQDTITLSIGGKIDYTFSNPIRVTARLLKKSADSSIANKRGALLLDINGIKTVILNNRRSFTELRDFKELGLDPLSFKVVIVKLGYLFPQLAAIAPEQLMALTPGFCNLDIPNLPYKQVNRPAYPLDPVMEWAPAEPEQQSLSLMYPGKATTTLVGDGKFIVKTTPDHFASAKGIPLNGRLHFFRQKDALMPASTLWNSEVFPGGVRYSIQVGHDSLSVTYGVFENAGFSIGIDAPLWVRTELETGESIPLEGKTQRYGDRLFTSYSQKADAFVFNRSYQMKAALEAPYRNKLLLESPLPTLNKAVAFSQALLDLSYNGELMYCELFRWLDIWARDLGSGLLPGALVSGRTEMARQSLVYDLNRYALMRPEDCKNSNDPSQGGTASEVGWTVRSIWNYYQHSGSRDSLKKDAAIMRPWVEHWIKRDYDEDGLITDVTDFMDHMIMMLSTNGVQTLASNSMYASLLLYASKIEAELGNTKQAWLYNQLYQRTTNALNTKFWNAGQGYFNNMTLWDSSCERSSQSSQAMLLKIGATDAVRTQRTLHYLRQNNWSAAGSITIVPRMNHVGLDNDQNVKVWPWWNLWEAEARFQHGDAAGGLHLLELAAATIEDEKYPGLIEETLETDGVSTGGNVFVTAAGNLLETVVKDLMGIEPVVPGWSTVKVVPAVPASWENYSCQVPTPNGFIRVEKKNNRLLITVTDAAIKTVLVADPSQTDLTGAVKQAWQKKQENARELTYTPVNKKPVTPLKKGQAVMLHEEGFNTVSAFNLPAITVQELENLGKNSFNYLIIMGNRLPLYTKNGQSVKTLLEGFIRKGGTIVLYGAGTNKKTEEDGAGILGEQNGLIDWYDYLPERKTTPLENWQFTPFDGNPSGTRRSAVYNTVFELDPSYQGKELHLELGPLVGYDSVYINGNLIATNKDLEPLIKQEYPTKTNYYDTHRYKMLSRYYTIKANSTGYKSLLFGKNNRIEVRITGDGLSRGIPESNKASIGILTDAKSWQATDEAIPGIGLANAKRKGVNYWGSEQFFNSWSTKHGLFGFQVNGQGVQFAAGTMLQDLPNSTLPVQHIYTDFALFKPWNFEALAYTTTNEHLLYPTTTERYPCIARIVHTETGGGFLLIAPEIAEAPMGLDVLRKLNILAP